MRKFALPLTMLLFAAALAFIGWRLVLNGRQHARLATAVEALRGEQEVVRAALRSTQAALDAVRQEQAQEHEELDELDEWPGGRLVRADLAAISAIRIAVAEYYLANGHMPAHQADAGLPAPDQYRGRSLRSATVHPDGSIDLVFDAASGVDGGRIRFVADTTHAVAMGVQWHCETADYPLIGRVVPGCRYLPPTALKP